MNYETSIKINTKKENAFNAVVGELDKWWGKVDNSISKIDDEFSISFGKTNWRFLIT